MKLDEVNNGLGADAYAVWASLFPTFTVLTVSVVDFTIYSDSVSDRQ